MADSTKAPSKTTVDVIYNGITKALRFNPQQPVSVLLRQALKAFNITSNAHLMSLFNAAGDELQDDAKCTDAGIRAGDELVLRQSIVKGG